MFRRRYLTTVLNLSSLKALSSVSRTELGQQCLQSFKTGLIQPFLGSVQVWGAERELLFDRSYSSVVLPGTRKSLQASL